MIKVISAFMVYFANSHLGGSNFEHRLVCFQDELERLNNACEDINRLELELDVRSESFLAKSQG